MPQQTLMNMSCKKWVLVPYFINLTEKWNNVEVTALNIIVIILQILLYNNILQPFKTKLVGGVGGQTYINLT